MGAFQSIMVVDDDDMVRDVLESMLSSLGHTVATAADGKEGEEIFALVKPDIVFTDLKMPRMDGLSLISSLKNVSPDLPIIVISGAGTLNEAIEAIRMGAWDYVTKPVTMPELEIVIQQACEKTRLIAENKSYQHYLEDLILERTLKLRDTDVRFRTLFESANDAIILMIDQKIVSCNNKTLQLFRCGESEIVGRTLLSLSPPLQTGNRDSAPLLHRHVSEALSGEPQFYEWRHRRQDGTEFDAEISLNRIKLQEAYHLQAIMRDISERKKAEEALLDNMRLKRELEIAREIQRSLLPAAPPNVDGAVISCKSIPAGSVGGDYYDFFTPDINTLDVVIADVAGHSMGSALLMVQARSSLRAKASAELLPGPLLSAVNDLLYEDLCRAELQISAFYARFDFADRTLTYANAGHARPLLLPAGTVVFMELDTDGLIMGVSNGITVEEKTISLGDDDLLVFYTDGVTESESPEGDFFGLERLKGAVLENRALHPEQIQASLLQQLATFSGKDTPNDDLSVIILKTTRLPQNKSSKVA